MDKKTTPVKHLDITIRAKNVLIALGIYTLEDLHLAYLLETIPKVGTIVKHYPYVLIDLVYTNKVNEEVKALLKEYSHNVLDVDSVGT
jgi:hypothetical protein